MTAPRVSRAGRPFLAPIWMAILAALLVGTVLSVAARLIVVRLAEPTTFVLLRHAEKALEPADDPVLTAEGDARAVRLANMLAGSAGSAVGAVYATDTRRSQATARPLAERVGLEVSAWPPGEPDEVIRELLRRHRGGTIVVVGHSNTVPAMVAALDGGLEPAPIADDDFATMFVVTVNRAGAASVLRLRY